MAAKGVLKIAVLDEPRWRITFREPVVVHGIAGLRKEVRAIAMLPDQDDAFSAARSAPSAGDTPSALR